MEFFTIGVYHSSEDEFFNKITINNIDSKFEGIPREKVGAFGLEGFV